MPTKSYPVPAEPLTVEEIIKGSRFITDIAPVTSAAEAKAFLQQMLELHPDATHNCWAYNAGPPGDTRDIGYSDDGEPHGTAGKPILNVLLHSGVGELMAVVTRYYGGTKLGTGGLARAYGGGAQAAIDQLNTIEKVFYQYVTIAIDYENQGIVERQLKDFDAKIQQINFDQQVTLEIGLDLDQYQQQIEQLTNLCAGRIQVTVHQDSV